MVKIAIRLTQLISISWGRRADWPQDVALPLDRVVVDSAFHGQGAARTLYEHLFEFAGSERQSLIVCEVNVDPPNSASDIFHRRLGFTLVGENLIPSGKRVQYLANHIDASAAQSNDCGRETAVADPTRRALLARLPQGEATVTELAEPFNMTAPRPTVLAGFVSHPFGINLPNVFVAFAPS